MMSKRKKRKVDGRRELKLKFYEKDDKDKWKLKSTSKLLC